MSHKFLIVLVLFLFNAVSSQIQDNDIDESESWYTIEGKVYPPEIDNTQNWQEETQILVNSGK
jgi:hypothetical protein